MILSSYARSAGRVEHFSEVFERTDVEAALAAGIFHRKEVPISAVKEHMRKEGIEAREAADGVQSLSCVIYKKKF